MAITITPVGPGTFIGPGLPLTAHTDFGGTLDFTTLWQLFFFSDSDRTKQLAKYETSNDVATITAIPFPITGADHQNFANWLSDGQTVYWDARIDVEGDIVDESNGSATWSNTVGLYQLLQQIQTQAGTGQFTTTDRSNLATIQTNVNAALTNTADILGNVISTVTTATGTIETGIGNLFAPFTLDALTLQEVTSGETCETVTVGDLEFFFGIVVKCTTIPTSYGIGGLDFRHYEPQLALLNVFRGTELVARQPIHIADYMLTPVPGQNNSTEAQIVYLAVAPNLSLEVWWGNGVCGQVYLLRLP